MRSVAPVKKYVAVAAAVALTGWAGTGPALAAPGNGNGNGNGGAASQQAPGQAADGPGKGNGNGAKPGNGPKQDGPKQDGAKPGNGPKQDGPKPGNGPKQDGPKPGNGPKQDGPKPGNGPKQDGPKPGSGPKQDGPKPGNGPKPAGAQGAPGNGDPAGNNGTVKIAPLGELDGIPNNSPHPGCTFQVEWYGFDEGADIVSTVSFAMHAPTSDVGLAVDGPGTVFVGGDPASGAGTDTGLDGTATYTLSFDGEPHPKQGYHVKLTVATPKSNGNDTKTKVFWVEPCETAATPDETEAPAVATPSEDADVQGTTAEADTADGTDGGDAGVLGIDASASPEGDAEVAAAEDDAAVPTAVDAGEDGNPVVDFVSSPVPLIVIGLGLALGAVALLRRRQGA